MTGQVFAAPPLHRVSVAYSIDSFSEHSTVAVSRTPTRAIVPPSSTVSFANCKDEELFRELFADNDANDSTPFDAVFGASAASPQKKSTLLNKAIVWHTGATLTKPFGGSPPSFPCRIPTTPVAPSLSVPLPRQNAVDLMTAHPLALKEEAEPSMMLGLSRVPEVGDEDDDDGLTTLAAKQKSARRLLESVSPRWSMVTPGLKSFLTQPRPNVTQFLPPSNQMNHGLHDPRVEEDIGSTTHRPTAASVPTMPTRKPLSSRKELQAEGSSRMAHMAQTYGTTTGGPRKARKETLERLANPISGHTSTLRALSPTSRKKREAEVGCWPPADAATTPVKTLTTKKTRDLIERLSEAQTNQGRTTTKKLIKGKRPVKVAVQTAPTKLSNNQVEVESTSDTRPRPMQNLEERKAELKQKLATRGCTQVEAAVAVPSSGATFLTQHEDAEAQLIAAFHRSGRKLMKQRSAVETKPTPNRLHLPQRPAVPPSVRTRVSSSSVTTPQKRSVIRTRPSSNAKGIRGDGRNSESSTSRLHGHINNEPARAEKKCLATSKKTGTATYATIGRVSSVLLGTATTNASKTPLASATKARTRLASVTKTKSNPSPESLPQVRRPPPTTPQRPAVAPASRRTHRVRPTNEFV